MAGRPRFAAALIPHTTSSRHGAPPRSGGPSRTRRRPPRPSAQTPNAPPHASPARQTTDAAGWPPPRPSPPLPPAGPSSWRRRVVPVRWPTVAWSHSKRRAAVTAHLPLLRGGRPHARTVGAGEARGHVADANGGHATRPPPRARARAHPRGWPAPSIKKHAVHAVAAGGAVTKGALVADGGDERDGKDGPDAGPVEMHSWSTAAPVCSLHTPASAAPDSAQRRTRRGAPYARQAAVRAGRGDAGADEACVACAATPGATVVARGADGGRRGGPAGADRGGSIGAGACREAVALVHRQRRGAHRLRQRARRARLAVDTLSAGRTHTARGPPRPSQAAPTDAHRPLRPALTTDRQS